MRRRRVGTEDILVDLASGPPWLAVAYEAAVFVRLSLVFPGSAPGDAFVNSPEYHSYQPEQRH